jgi:magnesium-protoporphyrin IX monomethyl ester (oxidative) cyclase
MDIVLFNPYYSQKKEYYSFYLPAAPLGLMYLAGYLRKFGLASKIVELGIFDIKQALLLKDRVRFGLSDKRIVEILRREKPKIVGITSMYSVYYRDIMEIAQTIKKFNKRIKVVIGGNHASSYWNFVLKDKNIDFVVIGEGEQTFLELCQAILKRKKDYSKIKGIAFNFNKNGEIIRTRPRELIFNLDDIPFPARDLMAFEKYLATSKHNPYLMRYPATTIITSRGCPGHCVYCTVRAVWGRTWRGRSPQNVVDEIEELVNKYGVREIAFLDDSASVDKKRWNAICDELISRKLNIKWTTPNGIAHWTLDKPTIKKMYEAGCYRITFGIESGNPETRKFLGKPYPLKQAKELIQYANSIGMWTICTHIIGFPYEKMNSINDTIEFAKKCGTDFATFFLLIPQPTSDVYNYFRKENLLNFDRFFEDLKINGDEFEKINYILNETGADTKYFKKEELREIQKKAYREFITYRALSYLFDPTKLVRKIRSKEDLFYLLRLLSYGAKIFLRTINPLNLKSSDFLYKKRKFK